MILLLRCLKGSINTSATPLVLKDIEKGLEHMSDQQNNIELLHKKLNALLSKQKGFAQEIQSLSQEIQRIKNSAISEDAFEEKKIVASEEEKQISTSQETISEKAQTSEVQKPKQHTNATKTNQVRAKLPTRKSNLEKFIGENLINKIGIAILVIGVAIGAKYSIENNLISPLTRIILGYLTGLGLIGFGIKLKAKYENYSAVLQFYAIFLAYKLIANEKFKKSDVVFLMINSFIFFGLGYSILSRHDIGQELLGVFTLINAVIHFIVCAVLFKKKLADRNLFYLVAGMVLIFITIAVPVQLDGNWVTLLWSLEAALLFWIGRTKNVPVYERLSYPLMILAFFSLLQDWSQSYEAYSDEHLSSFMNITFLTSLIFIAAFGFINWINRKEYASADASNKHWMQKFMAFGIPIIFLIAIFGAFYTEIQYYWDKQYWLSAIESSPTEEYPYRTYNSDLRSFGNIWSLNFTLFFVSALAFINIKILKNRILGIVTLGLCLLVTILFLTTGLYIISELRESFIYEDAASSFGTSNFNIGIRYVAIGFFALLMFGIHKLSKAAFMRMNANLVFVAILHISILWILSSELLQWLDLAGSNQTYKLGLSILWGVYSLFLIAYGIYKNNKYLRIGAIALFAGIISPTEVTTEEAINRIHLDFENKNFDWKVVLEGSQNQNEWFTILDDYRVLSIQNEHTDYRFSNLEFPDAKYRFYRVLVKTQEKPELKSAKISVTRKLITTETSELKLYIDSVETEKGWRYSYSEIYYGTLNRIEKNEFTFPTTLAQKFRVSIQNNDNQPLTIAGVSAKGYVHELHARFSKPATYYLAYGKANDRKPQYDIAKAGVKIPKEISSLTLDNIIEKIPNQILPLAYTGIIYLIVEKIHGTILKDHEKKENKFFSAWKAAGIGFISLMILATIAISYIFLSPVSIEQKLYNANLEVFTENENESLKFYDNLNIKSNIDLVTELNELVIPKWQENVKIIESFGTPIYVNDRYPFEKNPPLVPDDNPTGVYKRKVNIPTNWANKQVLLVVGAIKSAAYFWINGEFIGYNQDSKTEVVFDVTKYADTEIDITIQAFRWCDGSYLECQDFWRLSGIEREVYLIARNPIAIVDHHTVASLENNFKDGKLVVNTRVGNITSNTSSGEVLIHLKDDSGTIISTTKTSFECESDYGNRHSF
ncbi:Beta-galactosidase [Nymphon striatum]|nr:Beta-galactosidase [Nymphon striatum]